MYRELTIPEYQQKLREWQASFDEVCEQRDELLAACKALVDASDKPPFWPLPSAFESARAVVAKVERENEAPPCEACGGRGTVPPLRLRYHKELRYYDHGAPAHEWATCEACDGSGVREG